MALSHSYPTFATPLLWQQASFINALPFVDGDITIREITATDFMDFHEIATSPMFSYYCFDGTKESTQAFINHAIRSQRRGTTALRTSFMLAVEEITTHKVIGHVTADILDKDPSHYDIAYFTHPRYQGRGIAQHASSTLLRHMFELLNVDAVVATAHPDNAASLKVLSRLGFEPTGKRTEVKSTNGKNERLSFQLTRSKFGLAQRGISTLRL